MVNTILPALLAVLLLMYLTSHWTQFPCGITMHHISFLYGNCADLSPGLCRVSGAAFQSFNPSTLKKLVPEYMQAPVLSTRSVIDQPGDLTSVML